MNGRLRVYILIVVVVVVVVVVTTLTISVMFFFFLTNTQKSNWDIYIRAHPYPKIYENYPPPLPLSNPFM
jgi:flagellar basal body-associated protein FliL